MKNKMTKFIFAILFLAGLSLLLYPLFSNEWNNYRQNRLISDYDEAVAVQTSEGIIDYAGERAEAQAYNESLKPYILPDSFAAAAMREEPDRAYLSCLNLTGDGMMGYVDIPKIDIRIPIFHTTDEAVLQTAAGHLEGSSLPVGGRGTHTVISAHRGLPSAALFTDLDRLEEGDYFFLYILDEILCYQVDRVTVAKPEDTTGLAAEDDRDLATLLTCTPYGVNSHRLLVRGQRVDYEEIEDIMAVAAGYSGPSLHTNYLLWVIVGLSVTGVFICGLIFYDRRQRVKAAAAGDSGKVPDAPEDARAAYPGGENGQEHGITRGKAMKRKIANILFALVFLAGFGIFAYPAVSDQWNAYRQNQLISTYDEVVARMEEADYSREWEAAGNFNSVITENYFYGDAFGDGETELEDTEYWKVLNAAGDGVMGYMTIPKIHVRLAIYHGVADDVLQTGIGHLEGTGLPIGGEGCHSVLAAHRGLPSAKLFTDLDQMEPGDRFYLHILDEVLAYEVDQVLPMIDKDDLEALMSAMQVVSGEDHVTLLTCTPYGVNSHRLLVRGVRTEYNGEEEPEARTPVESMVEAVRSYYMLYLVMAAATILLIGIMAMGFRRAGRRKHK